MNRSTCQHCGKKRYQDRMKMINPKSLKNGKPEWACFTCIDSKYVQVSAEPILFPNSARHFNGVLMEGEKCGICHHAHGREVCDECKAQILDCSGYGTATELDALEHKKWCADLQWTHYKKNPRKTTKVEYNELLLKSLEFKIGVLNKRIFALKATDKKEVPEQIVLVDELFAAKAAKTITEIFFSKSISKGFIFQGKQFTAVRSISSGEKGLIQFTAYQAVQLSEYKGDVKPMYKYDHHEAIEKGERERGYPGQIIFIDKKEYVLVNPAFNFVPVSTDKTYHSKDQSGNIYFLDNKTKEWLIHDGKKHCTE